MKTCHICKKSLDYSEFYANRRRSDGYQTYCKTCSKTRRAEYLSANRDKERQYKTNARKRNADKLETYKKTLSCSKCNETRWYVLDFHHPNDDKLTNVSNLASSQVSWQKVLAEIGKCIPLCANCHREQHYMERINAKRKE